jgi:hypothetical protein
MCIHPSILVLHVVCTQTLDRPSTPATAVFHTCPACCVQAVLCVESANVLPAACCLLPQIEKLLRAAAAASAGVDKPATAAGGVAAEEVDDDELAAAPRPDQLVARAGAAVEGASAAARGGLRGADGGEAGVYRPPKLNPVSMEGCVWCGLELRCPSSAVLLLSSILVSCFQHWPASAR